MLVKLNRFAEAIEDYTVAITYYPQYGLAYYNRSLTWHRLGNKAEACKDLHQAAEFGTRVPEKVMSTICNK
jgi:tetratricopeptide (TPR) repeat protein